MEQDGVAGSAADAGGAGSTAPPGAEASTTPRAPPDAEPAEGKGPAAAQAQGAGQEEPGKEKAAAAEARDAGRKEPAKEEPKGGEAEPSEKGPAAAGARDGGKEEPVKGKALPEGEPQGGTAEPAEGKVPAAAQARGAGKGEPPKKAEAAAEPQAGNAAQPAQEKGPAGAGAQDGGKEEPTEKAGGVPEAEGGGKTEPTEGKAPAAVEAEGGKAEPAEGTAQARDGAGEEPVKEKAPAAAKAQEGGKKAAKAEKTPAAKKPAKEKAPAAVKDGGKEAPVKEKATAAPAKVEKSAAVTKAQDGGKGEPPKEGATAAAKEEATAAAEKAPATATAQDGGKEPTKEEAPAAAEAQPEGEKAAGAEVTSKQQPPRGPEPARPALLQSLSCPAACQREERPGAEVAAMEMIPEETAVAAATEGLVEPALAQGDLRPPKQPDPAGSAGIPQERTLPGAAGQPQPASEPPGDAEQPGPGAAGQPSSTEGEPPPSPYLTPDFGKEDPFEILDDVPPPPAPFAHRIVTLRSASVSSQFSLSSKEILGGGKFGEVHTCTEKQTGLKLAAKVIKKQGAKDKEMVLLEIDVMNQLNHRNLIQLYDAIETPREIILFMEFIEGGELFERIVDDDYHLTEVDCMVFVRQICEGIRFMHHMRVLHLDLKPENILCVAATGHMVKIIDFGLARRYNPQEKLKVNFGTPEFLSPEVVNYEQVSYSTDMWSMGVITYMLLSGLSPFLGDNDTETLNNVLAANWYFDEETFEGISDEAKDFVSNLIIKEKSGRMSAGQCLKHPWLNNLAEKAKRCNRRLKSQVLLKKYVMRRRWKKNFIGVCAANRFKKITSSGSLTALGV
ncbi:LOW QUALITY PROTEIN: myosin light chain kinase 2, skeletal/cardiac muscle [Cygnus atratus]|uniref:LOW QUALITY PROTEIN: myosin light chain kinase 2, skeletal/cardiac muscle n=1 Tax=Cygnus atratus TaxID=8868 RepID=UPI0015D5E0F3|nr:LOW QUALITY PROTEIN: myosin light chain kinase 2, skeletal/cardiac muscle [Cygnus atratus]